VVSRWLASWRRNRLFRKYLVPFVAVVLLALLSNGLLEIYFAFQENKFALAQIQREKAAAAALRIEGFVKEIERQMGWTTQPPLAVAGGLEPRRLDYLRLLRQVLAITEVAYLDAQGREQLRIHRLAMDVIGSGIDRSSEPRFTETRGGQTWYGPVYFRKESEPYMALAIPHGKGGGVSAAEVNLKFIWDVVSQIRIGKFGHAYVVDASGLLIAHPDISLVLKKTDLSALPQIRAARAAVPPADGWDDGMIATSLDGRRSLVAHTSIAPLGWLVVVEQPLIEAFAPLRGSILRTGLLMLLGVLVSVAASFVLARKMMRPIQVLHAGAARIGAGDLAHQLEVKTRDELEDLAGEFNRMTARLRDSYATLEQRVEERTRELRESLDQQTATAEILGAISSSPTDLRPVMEAVVKSAATLCEAQNAQIFRVEGSAMRLVARWGPVKSSLEVGEARPITRASVSGRTILDRRMIHEPDLLAVVALDYADIAPAIRREGIRTTVGVPLMREETPIGSITAFRTEVKPFSDKQVALLQTFADQAVIAIENVRLFNEIQDKTRELEAANRHKDEFLASMSHELRTPLNAVIGFSEVLLERMFGELNAKQEEYLNDILASGRHLLSLINDILDLAKIEAGRMELDLEDFEVAQAIDNAVVLVRERATRKGLALDTALGPALGTVRGDQRKVKQVLLNLLSNAVKFTPEGGRVEVRAQRADGHIQVSVTDTGIGIAAEDQDAVFEEFRQVGTDYAKKHEGTGLGLTLSRKFVELHGGHITLTSQRGHGSTFTFTLPVQRWPTS
jgi:signal transduction histidine kinase/HAMP domain-containing protein